MNQPVITTLLATFLASITIACPPPTQDIAKANCMLGHLRHRQMKSDANDNVWYLDISEQDAVTDATLAALQYLPHLREAYMIYCPIKGDGLAHIVALKHLQNLDLYATQIDDRALKYISKVKSLKYLNIVSVGVSDMGRLLNGPGAVSDAGLAMVAKLPNLEKLLFSGTVTDNGLRHLVKLKKLRYIEIGSPNVTAKGIEWLQKAMPNVEVYDLR